MGHGKQKRDKYYQKILAKSLLRHKKQPIKQHTRIVDWDKLANHLKPKQ